MKYEIAQNELRRRPRTWLVTGAAGFIGSHLVEKLLMLDQRVVALDNLSTGRRANIAQIQPSVSAEQWKCLYFIEGDICCLNDCRQACTNVDYVLHQASLGSIPRSIADPLLIHNNNVNGFINLVIAARDLNVKRFVYASSSAVYGDSLMLPKMETNVGKPLSPYAATKLIDEIYAGVFNRCYGLPIIGLRYFNVFGPRQDPSGTYAAVIPKWIAAILEAKEVIIYGDGETSRDFCYIANVVQANLLAAVMDSQGPTDYAYNISVGERTSLNELHYLIQTELKARIPTLQIASPRYQEFRIGDARHSQANIDNAKATLGYLPSHTIIQGLRETIDWYIRNRI